MREEPGEKAGYADMLPWAAQQAVEDVDAERRHGVRGALDAKPGVAELALERAGGEETEMVAFIAAQAAEEYPEPVQKKRKVRGAQHHEPARLQHARYLLQQRLRRNHVLDDLEHHNTIERSLLEDTEAEVQIEPVGFQPHRGCPFHVVLAEVDERYRHAFAGHPAGELTGAAAELQHRKRRGLGFEQAFGHTVTVQVRVVLSLDVRVLARVGDVDPGAWLLTPPTTKAGGFSVQRPLLAVASLT